MPEQKYIKTYNYLIEKWLNFLKLNDNFYFIYILSEINRFKDNNSVTKGHIPENPFMITYKNKLENVIYPMIGKTINGTASCAAEKPMKTVVP